MKERVEAELRFEAKIQPKSRVRLFPKDALVRGRSVPVEQVGVFYPREVFGEGGKSIGVHQVYGGDVGQFFPGAMPIDLELLNVVGRRMRPEGEARALEWAWDLENNGEDAILFRGVLRGEVEEC